MLSTLLSHRRCCFPPAAVRPSIAAYVRPCRHSSIHRVPLPRHHRRYRHTRHHPRIINPLLFAINYAYLLPVRVTYTASLSIKRLLRRPDSFAFLSSW